jgi:hypothetical protein
MLRDDSKVISLPSVSTQERVVPESRCASGNHYIARRVRQRG